MATYTVHAQIRNTSQDYYEVGSIGLTTPPPETVLMGKTAKCKTMICLSRAKRSAFFTSVQRSEMQNMLDTWRENHNKVNAKRRNI